MEDTNLDLNTRTRVNREDGEDQAKPPKDYQRLASLATSIGSMAGLYCLILICTSAVFIITNFVGNKHSLKPADIIYTQIFTMTIYGIGGIFTTGTFTYIYFLKKRVNKRKIREQQRSEKPERSNSAFVLDSVSFADSGVSGSRAWKSSEEVKEQYEQKPVVAFNAEGCSFFARMGLMGFGLGTTLLDGMRMMQYIGNPGVMDCYGTLYLASSGFNIYFVWCEMFFLLKYHTLIINFHHIIMKFGLAHLIATNMSTWIITVVIEGALSIMKSGNGTDDVVMFGCTRERTIYDEASSYLYPFAIEFSLLAASIVFRISRNIGVLVIPKDKPISKEEGEDEIRVDCHRSHTGLYYGFIIFVGIVCASCLYIYYDVKSADDTHHGEVGDGGIEGKYLIYLITAIIVSGISFIVLIPTIVKLHTLRYSPPTSLLDQHLLVVAVIGYYMLFGLVSVPALYELGKDQGEFKLAQLVVAISFIEFAQVTLQVVAISHGLRRRAWSAEQVAHKPGRSLLTFLIIINMGMWILNTFLLKGLHHMSILSNFYGLDIWAVLMHMFMPLSIFYRFHAACCFAEIWSNAYTREEHCTITFSDIVRDNNEETAF